jgi:hypothetical protein
MREKTITALEELNGRGNDNRNLKREKRRSNIDVCERKDHQNEKVIKEKTIMSEMRQRKTLTSLEELDALGGELFDGGGALLGPGGAALIELRGVGEDDEREVERVDRRLHLLPMKDK